VHVAVYGRTPLLMQHEVRNALGDG
jgi:hypothetical protein